MTNSRIENQYLRCFLAHELWGLRKVYWRCRQVGIDYDLFSVASEARSMAARFQTHLMRHGAEMLNGDAAPLRQYPPGFAGH